MAGYGTWRRRGGYLAATVLVAALAIGCSSSTSGGGGVDYLPGVNGSRTYQLTEFDGAGFSNTTMTVVVLDLEPASRATSLAQVGGRLTSSDGQFANTELAVGGIDTNRILGSATTTGGVTYRVTIDLLDGSASCRLTLANNTLGQVVGIGAAVASNDGGGSGGGDPDAVPRLSLSTTAVDLPDGTASGTVDIANSGTGDLTWTASTTDTFLSLDQASGDGDATLTITADRTGLASGTHTGQVTINSNGGRLTVVVNVVVP